MHSKLFFSSVKTSWRLITVLLFPCCPLAVIWLIVAIVIYAIEGIFDTGSYPHIFEETDKAILPSIADSYALIVIASVFARMFWVTSLPHRNPRSICWAVCHTMCFIRCWNSFWSAHTFLLFILRTRVKKQISLSWNRTK